MFSIDVQNLSKIFKVKIKKAGFPASLKDLFLPHYKEVIAVNDISFSVEKGEILGFLGPNGSGKSTMIKMLTGILQQSKGTAWVLGLSPAKDREKLSRKLGTVFGQRDQLWAHLSPRDNFRLFGAIYDLEKAKIETKISELNGLFGLENFIDTPVRNLSLGQKIRCEIAVSMLHDPEILFLDEPTIGLDPVVKESVRALISRMNREKGTTIFLTSHDVGDIEKLCRRIIIINDGKIVTDSTVEMLKKEYFHAKILEIKTSERMKIFEREGVEILQNEEFFSRLKVDTSLVGVGDVLKSLAHENVLDMNIASLPLEKIIKKIYRAEAMR